MHYFSNRYLEYMKQREYKNSEDISPVLKEPNLTGERADPTAVPQNAGII